MTNFAVTVFVRKSGMLLDFLLNSNKFLEIFSHIAVVVVKLMGNFTEWNT